MSIQLSEGSEFDPLMAKYWFDPLITQMRDKVDRLDVYKAHCNAGDTHINISLDMGGLSTLPWVIEVCKEAVTEGGLAGIILMCMGDGHTIHSNVAGAGRRRIRGSSDIMRDVIATFATRHNARDNSDPGALGYDWLMANFATIYAAFRAEHTGDPNNSLAHRTVFVPGYDGVVPDWQPPSSVDRFLLMARRVIDAGGAGALGIELSGGYSKWGTDDGIERNNWTTDAGKAVDVILVEGPIDLGPPEPVPPNINGLPPSQRDRWTQFYQIMGRLIRPFHHLPGQTDDLNPPFYLNEGTSRGPFYACFWEYFTYLWTLPWRRGGSELSVERVIRGRQAARDAGCEWVG